MQQLPIDCQSLSVIIILFILQWLPSTILPYLCPTTIDTLVIPLWIHESFSLVLNSTVCVRYITYLRGSFNIWPSNSVSFVPSDVTNCRCFCNGSLRELWKSFSEIVFYPFIVGLFNSIRSQSFLLKIF